MKKLLLALLLILVGCGDKAATYTSTVYVDEPDTIESIVEEENYARNLLGQSLLAKGLSCKVSKTGLSNTYTMTYDFNLTNRPMTADNVLLPENLRPAYKNVAHTIVCKGQLIVVVSDYYVFTLGADDKALVKVGGKKLVEFTNDSAFRSASNSTFLKMGAHSFEVSYTQNGGGNQGLTLGMTNLNSNNFYR